MYVSSFSIWKCFWDSFSVKKISDNLRVWKWLEAWPFIAWTYTREKAITATHRCLSKSGGVRGNLPRLTWWTNANLGERNVNFFRLGILMVEMCSRVYTCFILHFAFDWKEMQEISSKAVVFIVWKVWDVSMFPLLRNTVLKFWFFIGLCLSARFLWLKHRLKHKHPPIKKYSLWSYFRLKVWTDILDLNKKN